MSRAHWLGGLAAAVATLLVVLSAPGWVALGLGLTLAMLSLTPPAGTFKSLTTRVLQLGVVALGAGVNLEAVLSVGMSGAWLTAVTLALAIGLGLTLGRALRVPADLALLLSVGTAICGGSAIAAVASVIKPKAEELSVSLALVFVLNAIALFLFPLLGHALDLPAPTFGRWAALAIHDTSSVVGAGLAYGGDAVSIATTTKLARALWIVPVTVVIAVTRKREGSTLSQIKWPWFIAGYLLLAALVTFVPALAPVGVHVAAAGRHLLVVALFLVGLSLQPSALATVGRRPLVLAVVLWLVVATLSLPLASFGSV